MPFNKTPETISEIVQSPQTIEELEGSPMKRKNLDLNNKLKVIHFMHKLNNAAEVDRICKTNLRTVLQW